MQTTLIAFNAYQLPFNARIKRKIVGIVDSEIPNDERVAEGQLLPWTKLTSSRVYIYIAFTTPQRPSFYKLTQLRPRKN